jgi:hypothetical protein
LLDRELPRSQCLKSARCGLAAWLALRRDLMRLSRRDTAAVRPHGGHDRTVAVKTVHPRSAALPPPRHARSPRFRNDAVA